MNKLGRRGQSRVIPHLLFEEIFDRLDIVVGGRFDGLDPSGVNCPKFGCDGPQSMAGGLVKTRKISCWHIGERNQPLDFDVNPLPHERTLGEPVGERLDLGRIAPI